MIDLHCFSNYFRVDITNNRLKELCLDFSSRLIYYTWTKVRGKWQSTPKAVYATTTADRREFRFHINLVKDFIKYLNNKGYPDTKITYNAYGFKPLLDTHYPTKTAKGWEPRDYQEPVIEYLSSDIETPNHLVTLATGEGKTSCLLFTMAKLQQTFLLLIRPAYMEKWYSDIHTVLECEEDEVVLVRGEADLLNLLHYLNNPDAKRLRAIILSNKTYQNWLKLYERTSLADYYDLGYPCTPDTLYEFGGIGVRVIDEGHLDFHLCFKADLYTNVPRSITLSASMLDENQFIAEMQQVMYPARDRYKAPPPKKYTTATAVFYTLGKGVTPQTSWHGRTDYSHGAYEEWLIRRKDVLNNYFTLINDLIKKDYIKNYKKGDRLLVFCYSIKMATLLTDYLTNTYPHLTVERYVEDDPYANVLEPDIRVSTVLSAGTGIDIKQLRVCILTQALGSIKSNIQAFGRLRELKDDPRGTQFYYLNCIDIPQHLKYHEKKVELFRERSKQQLTIEYAEPLVPRSNKPVRW